MSETQSNKTVIVEDDRTGMDPATLERAVLDHLFYTTGKDLQSATELDVYNAVAHATRDRLVQRWIRTQRTYYAQDVKRAYYLSAEFLLGRFLGVNLRKLGLWDVAKAGLEKYDLELERILEEERDPGLGNGGLGRLAACFLDSMADARAARLRATASATSSASSSSAMVDGWQQVEAADDWLRFGNVWEIARPEYTVDVRFYGRVEVDDRPNGGGLRGRAGSTPRPRCSACPTTCRSPATATTPSTPCGCGPPRLDRAASTSQVFNAGDYRRAVEERRR